MNAYTKLFELRDALEDRYNDRHKEYLQSNSIFILAELSAIKQSINDVERTIREVDLEYFASLGVSHEYN